MPQNWAMGVTKTLPISQHNDNTHVYSLAENLHQIFDETGKRLTISKLITGNDKKILKKSLSNKLGWLSNGFDKIKGTNTIDFIKKSDIPKHKKIHMLTWFATIDPLKQNNIELDSLLGETNWNALLTQPAQQRCCWKPNSCRIVSFPAPPREHVSNTGYQGFFPSIISLWGPWMHAAKWPNCNWMYHFNERCVFGCGSWMWRPISQLSENYWNTMTIGRTQTPPTENGSQNR